jgi:hypothetical protein
MSSKLQKISAIVLTTVLCATFAGCAMHGGGASSASPFVVVLPNGYLIDRDRSSNTRIVKRSGGLVVQGPIAGYTVLRNVVTGYVGDPPPEGSTAPTPAPAEKAAKYFVLDTTSGKVDNSLDTTAWNSRLKELGAPASPEITPPILPK